MAVLRSTFHNASGAVLDSLEPVQETSWQTNQQCIAIVQQTCNIGTHKLLGCLLSDEGSHLMDQPQLIEGSFADVTYVGSHCQLVIKQDTEVTDNMLTLDQLVEESER